MELASKLLVQVKGWSIDANRRNDPTYPIKRRNDGEQNGYTWERPPQQQTRIEILHSNERPNVTATFGTATPPWGLSGVLRRFAFRFSESTYKHWLPLILADRINMVEGIFIDLAHGRIPNIFAELGWRAEWKYNRPRFLLRVALEFLVLAAVVLGIIALVRAD
jgi:hypothetical protein